MSILLSFALLQSEKQKFSLNLVYRKHKKFTLVNNLSLSGGVGGTEHERKAADGS